MPRRLAFLAVAAAGAALDLWTKHLAFARPVHAPELVLVPGLLSVGRGLNRGIAFGFVPGPPWILLAVAAVAVPVLLAIGWRAKSPRWTLWLGLALVLAGTIGNGWDRAALGHVRDFVHVTLAGGRLFPWLFNLADAFIDVGVGLLIVDSFRKKPSPAP